MRISWRIFRPEPAKLVRRQDMDGLVRLAKKHRETKVREEAIRGIAEVAQQTQDGEMRKRCVSSLIDILDSDDSERRRDATRALIGVATITEIAAYVTPHNKRRNEHLIGALAEVGKTDTDGLVEILEGTTDKVAKWVIIKSIGRTGDYRLVRPLAKALHDSEWGTRLCAVEALGVLQVDEGAKAVAELLQQETNEHVRQTAAKVLSHLEGEFVVDAFVNLLGDGNEQVRELAANTLGRLAAPRAAPHLLRTLEDASVSVRNATAAALRQLGTPAMIEMLVAAIHHGDWFKKWALGEVLGNITGADAASHMAALVDSADEKVRAKAIQSLISTDRSALPVLMSMLTHESAERRAVAARILGIIGDRAAVEPLRTMEDREDVEWVRTVARAALGCITK